MEDSPIYRNQQIPVPGRLAGNARHAALAEGTVLGADQEKREAEIPRELANLEREVNLANETANDLVSRLEPFLRLESDVAAVSDKEQPTTTGAGAMIRSLAERVRITRLLLRSACVRLEV